jgi:hypothetical protein
MFAQTLVTIVLLEFRPFVGADIVTRHARGVREVERHRARRGKQKRTDSHDILIKFNSPLYFNYRNRLGQSDRVSPLFLKKRKNWTVRLRRSVRPADLSL